MTSKKYPIKGNGSVLDTLAAAFELLRQGPGQPSVNGRAICEALPQQPVRLDELARLLPQLSWQDADAVWRELIRRARSNGPVWVTVAAGLALPWLRAAAANATRGCRDEVADIDAEVLTEFLTALGDVNVDRPQIAWRLYCRAYNAGMRTRYASNRYAAWHVRLPEHGPITPPPAPSRHPDFVLADAVANAVITAREAELIGRTRLENRSLKSVARELGIPYETAKWQRRRGEQRLVEAISSEEIPSDHYPDGPSRSL